MVQLKLSTYAKEEKEKKKYGNKPETIEIQIRNSPKISSTGSLLERKKTSLFSWRLEEIKYKGNCSKKIKNTLYMSEKLPFAPTVH